jgi:hypothetical protein
MTDETPKPNGHLTAGQYAEMMRAIREEARAITDTE